MPAWSWQAAHDGQSLYLNIDCAPAELWRAVEIKVSLEPSHIYPRRTFRASIHGMRDIRQGWLVPDTPWEFTAPKTEAGQAFRMRIPFEAFQGELDLSRPMRLNISVAHLTLDNKKEIVQNWVRNAQRVQPRLGYGGDNPNEMGWLRLRK